MQYRPFPFVIAAGLLLACGPRQQAVAPAAPVVESASAAVGVSAQHQLAEHSVDAVIYHHGSAENYRLFQQGYELARLRLDANLAVAKAKPAVIVDVDETVLDNSIYKCARRSMAAPSTPLRGPLGAMKPPRPRSPARWSS
ncbi:MAG: hypothetical protein KF797_10280 [Flavobacteriales bacterium]|nr:hypothetical protein [Flavobacteriales bacterium]